MKNHLERLIKQTVPLPSPEIKAHLGILYLSYYLSSTQQETFKPYHITLQQFNILRILRGQYPKAANISLLRDRMMDKMSDASRLVNRLHQMGLVDKHPNEHDKRNTDVLITQKALDILNDIDQQQLTELPLFSKLDKKDLEQLNELIDKMLGFL
jgi:DNA-binding MarR family transcriptional regulator